MEKLAERFEIRLTKRMSIAAARLARKYKISIGEVFRAGLKVMADREKEPRTNENQ